MNRPAFFPPRSPFSTRLSGSARETELRIRNIFQWKKKRPPVWLMLLAALAILSCGGLVSCQQAPAGSSDGGIEAGTVWDALRTSADTSGLDDRDGLAYTMLASVQGEGYTLAALAVQDYYPRFRLVIGAADDATGELLGPVFETSGYGSLPQCLSITSYDGAPALLYVANGMAQGLSWGEAGLVSWDGAGLNWSWPVEGDILEAGSQAQADYYTYWADHLALMAPGGVDVFTQTNYSVIDGDGPQWASDHNETFWYTAEQDLPIGVYYQVRVWLEDFTRNDHNPLDASSTSAVWQIVSLAPADGVYRERNYQGEAVYDLTARAAVGEDLWFTASLLFDHGAGQVTEVQSCAMGTEEELAGASQETAIETRDRLIRAHLEARYSGVPQWYYLEDLPDQAEEGAMCVDSVTLLTTGETDGQRWSLFELSLGLYYSDGAPPLPNWHGGVNYTYLALGQREDGSYTEVLGNGEDYAYQLAPQMVSRLLDEEVCLYRDGFYYPVGPGKPLSFSCLDTMHIEEERLEDYEPIYNPGDYWFRSSGQVGGETFTALSYHDSASGRESLNTLDVTMTHLYTPRGVQVGDSREAVLEAYPTAVAGNYWGRYPGEDLLYYIPGLDPEQSDGFYDELGPAILFFFEGDTLRQITLTNMFN